MDIIIYASIITINPNNSFDVGRAMPDGLPGRQCVVVAATAYSLQAQPAHNTFSP
jgi:hypothetical protein